MLIIKGLLGASLFLVGTALEKNASPCARRIRFVDWNLLAKQWPVRSRSRLHRA